MDQLTVGTQSHGLVLLNYGDPAFDQWAKTPDGLGRSEAIFLHTLGYLLFTDEVSIPARYMLDGAEMAKAMYWSEALLEESIVVPERRHGVESFDDLAQVRTLAERGRRRAEFLDRHARHVRTFRYDALSTRYIELLGSDLLEAGGFCRAFVARADARRRQAIDAARADFISTTDGTPDAFVRSISKYVPTLGANARAWAMARYYITPLQFDQANTRELPKSAADLLIRGGVIDPDAPRFGGAAPAIEAAERLAKLHASLPSGSIESNHRSYCEAVLEVRRNVPEARTLFREIRDASHLKDAGDSLTAEFEKELRRQLGVRTAPGIRFVLSSSLIGAGSGYGAGLAVGADPITQLATAAVSGVVSGVASKVAEGPVEGRNRHRQAPWILAMDELSENLAQ